MAETEEIKVVVNVSEAEQNLEGLKRKTEETTEAVKELNEETGHVDDAWKDVDKAFEQALGKADPKLRGLGSSLTTVVKTVKNLGTAFKTTQKTGNSLWKSIKAGIASTGIGILLVVIGEVIGNWDKWSATIQKWLPWAKKTAEETNNIKEAADKLISSTEYQNKKINDQVRLMKAQGVEQENIILYKYQETKALRANIEAQIAETQAKINSIKAHSAFRRFILNENKALEGLSETLENLEKENNKLAQSQLDTLWDLKVLRAETARKRLEEEEKAATDAAKKGAEERKKIAEEEAKKRAEAAKKYADEFIKVIEKADDDIKKINQDLENEALPAFIQKWSSNEIFRDPELGKALAERVAQIQAEVDQETSVFDEAIQKRVAQLKTLTEMITKIESGEEQTPTGITLEELKTNLEKQKTELAKYYEYRVVLTEKGNKEQEKAIKEAYKERQKLDIEYREKELELDYKFAKESIQNLPEWERHKKEYELEQKRLQEHQTYLQELLALETAGTEEYKKLMLEIEEANYNVALSESQRAAQIKQDVEEEVLAVNSALQSIGDLVGSMSDLWEADLQAREASIKADLAAGKIKESLAKEQLKQIDDEYKRMQNLQVAETIINTIAGAVGAFMQASKTYPAPYGQIIGAATSAAVTLAGLAEIKKIKSTSLGSGESLGGGISSPSVGVTPIQVTDDIQPSPSVMGQSQSPTDQRVYILQSDLEESHRQVEVREVTSTF